MRRQIEIASSLRLCFMYYKISKIQVVPLPCKCSGILLFHSVGRLLLLPLLLLLFLLLLTVIILIFLLHLHTWSSLSGKYFHWLTRSLKTQLESHPLISLETPQLSNPSLLIVQGQRNHIQYSYSMGTFYLYTSNNKFQPKIF